MQVSVETYPRAAVERAMKVQEVILRAMAKKITWWQAAEIVGMSDRQMRRLRWRYGYDGLLDRAARTTEREASAAGAGRTGAGTLSGKVLRPERAPFSREAGEQHGITLSYTWVKLALQGAGLVAKARKRGVHRKQRVRRPLPGMLLHIDGSRHPWFQDDRWYDLIVILDDATSEIYYAQLVDEESTTGDGGLWEVMERKGPVLRLVLGPKSFLAHA